MERVMGIGKSVHVYGDCSISGKSDSDINTVHLTAFPPTIITLQNLEFEHYQQPLHTQA